MIKSTGMKDVLRLTRPDGSWVLLHPTEAWPLNTPEDVARYLELQVDLAITEEEEPEPERKSLLKAKFRK